MRCRPSLRRAALFKEFQDSLRDMLIALEKSECEASS